MAKLRWRQIDTVQTGYIYCLLDQDLDPWSKKFIFRRLEGRFPAGTADDLSRRGHDLAVLDDWSPIMGGLSGIVVDQESGALKAGADPRRDAYAIGR